MILIKKGITEYIRQNHTPCQGSLLGFNSQAKKLFKTERYVSIDIHCHSDELKT